MASSKVITDLFKDPAFITQYRNAEKVTGAFAPPLVQQSGIATFQGSPVILDSACGTGIVASTLVSMLGDEVKQSWELTCGDLSQGMVEYTRHRARDQGWPNTEVKLVNAQDMMRGRQTMTVES
ncbi:hypothetical protein ARAM_000243 [Aspergillus rambellii]|uniref:Methyltransferase domain-containing protein n=1 Tax=Aspergillus rambellii TaxID=308745 RepID=A0A0F8XSD8_9EURO|nr:hypothetical protein ARAM_000243 [Aspergillus rambellii]